MKVLILNYIASKYEVTSMLIFILNFCLIAISVFLLLMKMGEKNKYEELDKTSLKLIYKAMIITSILNFLMPETELVVKMINEAIK